VQAAAFNVSDTTKSSMVEKNSVTIRSGSTLSTVVTNIAHAEFPDLSANGGEIAYTALTSGGTGVTYSNIVEQTLTSAYYPISTGLTTVSTTTALDQNEGSDPLFLPGLPGGLLYHAADHTGTPSHDMTMAVKDGSGGFTRRVAGLTDTEGQFCGHFAMTADGAHVSCSRTDTQANYVMETNNVDGLPLLKVQTQAPLFWKEDSYYQALYPTRFDSSCDDGILHAYTEWGNTSNRLLVSVMCVHDDDGLPATEGATIASKLFLVSVDPAAPDATSTAETPDAKVINLSGLIEDYAVSSGLVTDGDDIDTCTGDFYIAP
jgi:hypothetical protein